MCGCTYVRTLADLGPAVHVPSPCMRSTPHSHPSTGLLMSAAGLRRLSNFNHADRQQPRRQEPRVRLRRRRCHPSASLSPCQSVCVDMCVCVWVHVRTFAEFRHEEGGDDELARVWPCRPPTYRHPACVAPHPVTCHRPVASAVRLRRLAYILLLDSYGALKRGNTDCPVSQPLAGRKFLPPPQPVRRCRPLRHRVMRHIRRQLTGV